jgi:hypothetical protein
MPVPEVRRFSRQDECTARLEGVGIFRWKGALPMGFDLDEGLYVFEVTLGYKVGDSEHVTIPMVVQADDGEEVEDIVMEYLEEMHLGNRFWIAEISEPSDRDEYERMVEEGERERWDRLEDYSEEDFQEILQSDDI